MKHNSHPQEPSTRTNTRTIIGAISLLLFFLAVPTFATTAPPFAGERSSFHNFDRYDFSYAGRPCMVVGPQDRRAGQTVDLAGAVLRA